MSWVNLDDVYVNKTGDSIAGNLSVGGTLTINNAKGNGGTYNVANEITTLRDSVSPMFVECNITKIFTTVCKVGNIVVVTVSGTINQALDAWGTLELSTTVPKANNRYNSHLFSQDTTDPRILLSVTGTNLFIESKGAGINNGSWTFGQLVYVCEQHSVSQDNDWITLNQFVKYKKTGSIVTVTGTSSGGFGFGGNDKYGTVGTLPSKYCPSIDIPFVFHSMGGTSCNKSALIDHNGDIKLYDRSNYISYWGFCVSYPIQYSVSQNGDWTIFNFGTGYALSTRKVYKTISATAPYGSLYFCPYRFNSPDIYDSILYADVNPVTGNGLWLGHYREINDTTTVICYLSSTTSMSNVGMYVQETVIGKLKQHSVSQSAYYMLYDSDKYGKIVFYSRGCIATLTVIGIAGVNVGTPWKVPSVIPVKFRPDDNFYSPLVHRQSNNVGQIWIPGKKADDPYIYIYAGVAPSANNNSLNGTVSWIYVEPDDLES